MIEEMLVAAALVALGIVSLIFYAVAPMLFSVLGPDIQRSFGWLVGWVPVFSLICLLFAALLYALARGKKK